MSEALREVRVGNRNLWTLFNSGAGRSYVLGGAVPPSAPKGKDLRPTMVGLGGRDRKIREWRHVDAVVDGCSFSFKAYVLDEIGTEEGRSVELIVGAPVMEEWEIGLQPAGRRRLVLDLTRLRERSFVDF